DPFASLKMLRLFISSFLKTAFRVAGSLQHKKARHSFSSCVAAKSPSRIKTKSAQLKLRENEA
ncbi:hypothetical protein J0E37_001729, partial [Campylobacter upsaliensis]|nr:hypothetical protein [Campylobacter upsaliensis]